MNSRQHVLQLLTSPDSRLLITNDEYLGALLRFFPLQADGSLVKPDDKLYAEAIKDDLSCCSSNQQIHLTCEFSSPDLDPLTLAYHRIRGLITSDSYWYFSSKQFEQDLLAAEKNPNITCHFLHITSGGGEAWYLDRVSETMFSLSKPIYTLIEKTCGSAAYYFACHGKVVRALTQNDNIGCIGTMIGFWDMEPYFESLGFRKIEEYAHKSKLKNKKYNDLKDGKPDQFITEELDPLLVQFENTVRKARKQLKSLPDDHPVVMGETYMADKAIEVGLIDGITTLPEAIEEAYELGSKWKEKQNKTRNKALTLI